MEVNKHMSFVGIRRTHCGSLVTPVRGAFGLQRKELGGAFDL
jgi:hypothetical protein